MKNEFRVGNIVSLSNSYSSNRYYISRIVCPKDGDYYIQGVYIDNYFNPNDSKQIEYLYKKDYTSLDICRRMTEIEGCPIDDTWLIDNFFETIDTYNNTEHDEIFNFIKSCFGSYFDFDEYDMLLGNFTYLNDLCECINASILYNRSSHMTYIVSYTSSNEWNKEELEFKNKYNAIKAYAGQIDEIHVLQNTLIDMGIDILSQFNK